MARQAPGQTEVMNQDGIENCLNGVRDYQMGLKRYQFSLRDAIKTASAGGKIQSEDDCKGYDEWRPEVKQELAKCTS